MTDPHAAPRALLEAYAKEFSGGFGKYEEGGFDRDETAPKAFAALRAILDLHKPEAPPPGHSWVSGGAAPHCEGCSTGDPYLDPEWPCDTVTLIVAALAPPEAS